MDQAIKKTLRDLPVGAHFFYEEGYYRKMNKGEVNCRDMATGKMVAIAPRETVEWLVKMSHKDNSKFED